MPSPLEMKQIAYMILDLKKSEKIVVVLRFDPRTSHTRSKHATIEPTLPYDEWSKYRVRL